MLVSTYVNIENIINIGSNTYLNIDINVDINVDINININVNIGNAK